MAAIKNFYETAVSQPPIPGTVLLFTTEKLASSRSGTFENVGNLEEPKGKYLIIDGQHRLAALHFYSKERPDEARTIHVPCIIFDGKSEDFATEMFVIINSTPTRINKSHLIDLYERVSWAAPDKKFAARSSRSSTAEGDSPLRYRINRLGGRSQQQKWILQAELFNELHRWVTADWKAHRRSRGPDSARRTRFYEMVRDFLKAAEKVWGSAWGNASYMVTRPVTLKAMLRVCADLAARTPSPRRAASSAGTRKLAPWTTEAGASAARASTSASRPRARSSASRASTASSAASRRLPPWVARPARARAERRFDGTQRTPAELAPRRRRESAPRRPRKVRPFENQSLRNRCDRSGLRRRPAGARCRVRAPGRSGVSGRR